ncbi:MAG: hypothetical protein GEU79_09805 [Acidimicrobiia bacterium]|nr:hypothetical protein [Acidimicrobiia bacterium]
MSDQEDNRLLLVVGLLMVLDLVSLTIGFIVDPEPFEPVATLLVGVGLWVPGVASVVGMMVSRSRWAYLTAWAFVVVCMVLLVVRPIGALWVISLLFTTTTAAGLIGLGVRSIVRTRPAATGPPGAAVVVALSMSALALAVGLAAARSAGWLELTVGMTGPLAAFWFIKTLPGALLLARVVWPAALLVAAPWMDRVPMVVVILASVTTAIAAWRPEVRTSVRPLTTKGSRVRIPPELAPREVLDSAGLDDKGRPE